MLISDIFSHRVTCTSLISASKYLSHCWSLYETAIGNTIVVLEAMCGLWGCYCRLGETQTTAIYSHSGHKSWRTTSYYDYLVHWSIHVEVRGILEEVWGRETCTMARDKARERYRSPRRPNLASTRRFYGFYDHSATSNLTAIFNILGSYISDILWHTSLL